MTTWLNHSVIIAFCLLLSGDISRSLAQEAALPESGVYVEAGDNLRRKMLDRLNRAIDEKIDGFEEEPYEEKTELEPVDPEWRDLGFIPFARAYGRSVYPNTVPGQEERGAVLSAFGAPGEREPLVCGLRTLETGVSGLFIELDDLVCLDTLGFIPADMIELGVVEYFRVRWGQGSSSGSWRWHPTRIWPLDLFPGNRFCTPGADGSFRVSPNTAQHFWLTVNVPPDAPAGNYAGNLWLRTYRGTCSIPIYFTVLPIALADDPLLPHGVLMSGPQDRAACRDLSLHGVNATSQWYRPAWMPVRYTRGSFSFDYQLQDAFMNRLASEGITGPHIIFAGSARDAVLDRALTKASGIGLDDPSFAPAYAQAVQSIFSHGRKSGWNRTVWGILDRCLPDSAALDFFTVRAQAVKKLAGGTVSLIGPLIQRQEREQAQEQGEVEGERVERLFPCVDIWFTGGMNGQMRQVSPGGVRTWGYAACTQRNSAFESRYQVGFGPWHRRLDGVFIWAYNWTGGGHSWNDFDGPVMDWMLSYRDLDDRYLPTPAWEGFREGVDDRRYILTMEMLLSSIHPADSLARESRLALESLRQVLEGHGIDSLHVAMPAESPVSTDNSPMGLARSLIAGHIIRLTRLFPPQDLDQNRR